jgi:hypothetical protein
MALLDRETPHQSQHRRSMPLLSTGREDCTVIQFVSNRSDAGDPCGLHVFDNGSQVLCALLSVRFDDGDGFLVANLLAFESASTIGIGAALAMKVDDVYVQNRRLWVRLHEKGGKRHEMPCHHNLETYLEAYLDGAGIRQDPKGPLFRTIGRQSLGVLARTLLAQADCEIFVRSKFDKARVTL